MWRLVCLIKKSGGKFIVMRTDYDCEYTKENARRTVNTANIVSNYAIALKHSDYNNYDNYSLS